MTHMNRSKQKEHPYNINNFFQPAPDNGGRSMNPSAMGGHKPKSDANQFDVPVGVVKRPFS